MRNAGDKGANNLDENDKNYELNWLGLEHEDFPTCRHQSAMGRED
jgi:hypothetical protein